MSDASLKHRTLSNTTYNFFGYVFPILFSVFITPIIVSKLGVKDYGLMVFVTALLGLLSLLDFGVSASTSKNIAQYMVKEDRDNLIKRLIKTSRTLFLLIGTLGAILVILATLFVFFFMNEKVADMPIFYALMLISAFTFFISSQNTINALVPNALERFDIKTKLGVSNLVITSVASLIIVLNGGKLLELFMSQAIITIVFFFISRHYARKLLPVDCSGYGWSLEEIRKAVSWSAYSSLNELARTSLFSLDRILIPFFLGISSLAYYTLPGNITARIPGISDNMSGVIFPVSARLQENKDIESLKRVYTRSSRLIMLVSFAITAAIIANGYEILRFWLSEDIAKNSYVVLVILSVTNLILSLMSPVATYLMTMDKWRFYTLVSGSMAILNMITILILMPRFGIEGAAIAYLISTLPIFFAIYNLETKYLGLRMFWSKWIFTFLKFGCTFITFFIINNFLIKPFIIDLPTLIFLGPLSVLVFFGIHYCFGFIDEEDVRDVRHFIKK